MLRVDECNCPCHIYDTKMHVNHFGPCCRTCDICHKNINIDCYDLHIKDCKPMFEIDISQAGSGIKNETFDQMIRRKKDGYMRKQFE